MQPRTIEGTLVFTGVWLDRPWLITDENGVETDLYDIVHAMAEEFNGKRVNFESGDNFDHIVVELDDASLRVIEYKPDLSFILSRTDKFGIVNLLFHFIERLTWLSGRRIKVEVTDTSLSIVPLDGHSVHKVYLGSGNLGQVSKEEATTVCGFGRQGHACIFLGVGGGFSCLKFQSFGRELLNRHVKGDMNSPRVGDCALGVSEELSKTG